MTQYLGETPIAIADSPFADYSPADWAMREITLYSGIDGDHHKDWLLDRVARLLKNAPVENLRIARWSTGEENWRYDIGTSPEYEAWVVEMLGEYDAENDEYEYEYSTGRAP